MRAQPLNVQSPNTVTVDGLDVQIRQLLEILYRCRKGEIQPVSVFKELKD